MSVFEIVGLIATVLSILGIVIAVAIRLSSFPSERKISSLESENTQLRTKLDEMVEGQKKLVEALTLIKTVSSEAQVLVDDINQELNQLALMIDVKSASVLVPYPPGSNSRLAFLTTLGLDSDNVAIKLKKTLVDTNKSIAGIVFISGQARIDNKPFENAKWNSTVDKRIVFTTERLLCLPLFYSSSIIGVVQFLNKPTDFTEQDKNIMEKSREDLSF